jgi:16S rRNA (guanine(966)-N(2))-methyltransferase RsmD
MGKIRITSGTLRGRSVDTPEGEGTRPLLTRLRKSLADLLRPRLAGTRVLDLFGGSGAVAFELLSNGAREAVVVELDRDTARLIECNAARLQVPVAVAAGDALDQVPLLAGRGERFDVIVIAPPYGAGLQQKALDAVAEAGLLAGGGVVVVQRDHREPLAAAKGGLRLSRSRSYGRTVFDFYEQGPGCPGCPG